MVNIFIREQGSHSKLTQIFRDTESAFARLLILFSPEVPTLALIPTVFSFLLLFIDIILSLISSRIYPCSKYDAAQSCRGNTAYASHIKGTSVWNTASLAAQRH